MLLLLQLILSLVSSLVYAVCVYYSERYYQSIKVADGVLSISKFFSCKKVKQVPQLNAFWYNELVSTTPVLICGIDLQMNYRCSAFPEIPYQY
jgi:hypothetical protein